MTEKSNEARNALIFCGVVAAATAVPLGLIGGLAVGAGCAIGYGTKSVVNWFKNRGK